MADQPCLRKLYEEYKQPFPEDMVCSCQTCAKGERSSFWLTVFAFAILAWWVGLWIFSAGCAWTV